MHVTCPKGSRLAGTLESQQTVIEHITKETAMLFDCVSEYEEKGRLGQVRTLWLKMHAVALHSESADRRGERICQGEQRGRRKATQAR
jgi:hypothetical protein